MWLTGFDVPFLEAIYIDKPIQQHSLIQTISRVNRVYEGKEVGLVVDYIGIKGKMNMDLCDVAFEVLCLFKYFLKNFILRHWWISQFIQD